VPRRGRRSRQPTPRPRAATRFAHGRSRACSPHDSRPLARPTGLGSRIAETRTPVAVCRTGRGSMQSPFSRSAVEASVGSPRLDLGRLDRRQRTCPLGRRPNDECDRPQLQLLAGAPGSRPADPGPTLAARWSPLLWAPETNLKLYFRSMGVGFSSKGPRWAERSNAIRTADESRSRYRGWSTSSVGSTTRARCPIRGGSVRV
jgi:hypothetical protein